MLQIIAPEQDKYIKRTPDGTPMEVALTQDLDHPNIVRTLRHASFQSQVSPLPLLSIIQFTRSSDVAQTEFINSAMSLQCFIACCISIPLVVCHRYKHKRHYHLREHVCT